MKIINYNNLFPSTNKRSSNLALIVAFLTVHQAVMKNKEKFCAHASFVEGSRLLKESKGEEDTNVISSFSSAILLQHHDDSLGTEVSTSFPNEIYKCKLQCQYSYSVNKHCPFKLKLSPEWGFYSSSLIKA